MMRGVEVRAAESTVHPVFTGTVVAGVVAGPPLWSLVQEGTLDSMAALERGAIVAVACVLGAMLIDNVITGYRTDAQLARGMAALERSLAEAEEARVRQEEAQAASADGEDPRTP